MSDSVGIPAETKDGERRVALDPIGVATLTRQGIDVRIEAGAGSAAGFDDDAYRSAGARVVDTATEAWAADLVVKVKEPLLAEWCHFRPGLRLFAYLHLAADPVLARALAEAGVEAHAFETVTDGSGLPLLAPMSEVAGRASVLAAASFLAEGAGTLLGGAAGVPPARVAVIGLGVAGTMAARGARGLDAEVIGIDVDLDRLRAAHQAGTVTATLSSAAAALDDVIGSVDVVIGAALIPGARAPVVLSTEHVAAMRPGSVVVDLAIDQGGCIETSRPTSLSRPVFEAHGVVHYCVTNVPGQFPRTASRALSAAVAPRARDLALGLAGPVLAGSLNVAGGEIAHPTVAASVTVG